TGRSPTASSRSWGVRRPGADGVAAGWGASPPFTASIDTSELWTFIACYRRRIRDASSRASGVAHFPTDGTATLLAARCAARRCVRFRAPRARGCASPLGRQTAATNGACQRLEHLHAFVPADAAVGDALAVHERLATH